MSRRSFIATAAGGAIMATAGVARAQSARPATTIRGVTIGGNSYCFPDRPLPRRST